MASIGRWSAITPPGSTLFSRTPSWGPPCLKKYHQGMPFCAVSTMVAGERIERDVGRDRRQLMRLDREHDKVRAAGFGDAIRRVDARDDLFAALLQHEAAFADGLQVLSACNDAHGFAGRGELGRQEAADRPRPDYGDVHRSSTTPFR